jgi:predicted MFS family arabinose efflux permease
MLRQGGAWTARIFFNVYMDAALEAPTSLIGILAACGQILSVPTALVMPNLARRWGKSAALLFSILSVIPGLLLMALIPGWPAAGIGYMLVSAIVAFGNAAYHVYSQEIVSPDLRPMVSGATSLAFGLGTSAVAFGGGFVIARSSYQALFLLGSALVVLGALVFWSYFRRPRGEMLSTRGD